MNNSFNLFIEGDGAHPFTNDEIENVSSFFMQNELPLHYVFRADVRWKKETTKFCIVAISPHLVRVFSQKRLGSKISFMFEINLYNVQGIAQPGQKYAVLLTPESKFVCRGKRSIEFVQIAYRNCFFLNDNPNLILNVSHQERFPSIAITISPSQRFQFLFSSICSDMKLSYKHEVVRYFHNHILSKNPIFDFSDLPPITVLSHYKAIFQALEHSDYFSGIAATNVNCPNLLSLIDPKYRIINLENCGISSGLRDFYSKLTKRSVPVSYWNLSRNQIRDIEIFPEILKNSTRFPLFVLSLSHCCLTEEILSLIFDAILENRNQWTLHTLKIAGAPLSGKALVKFDTFLNSEASSNLRELDIGSTGELNDKISVLITRQPKIESLNIENCHFSVKSFQLFLNFLKENTSLRKLNISGTKLTPDQIADVILTISENKQLKDFSIKMNRLNLNGPRLLSLFRAFLTSSDDTKWKSLSFDDNGINDSDLKNMIPLFQQLSNLQKLSLNYNFSNNMSEINSCLAGLLSISSLRTINIRGDPLHFLSQNLFSLLSDMKRSKIECIDISGNQMGDSGYNLFKQIIHSNHKLRKIKIDGNSPSSIDVLNDLVNEKISIEFPVNDVNKLRKTVKGAELISFEIKAADLQQTINRNKQFSIQKSPEIIEMVDDFIQKMENCLESENIYRHSCICEVFNLPFPFQKVGETINCKIEEIDINDQTVYKTPSMARVCIEPNKVKSDIETSQKVTVKEMKRKPLHSKVASAKQPKDEFKPKMTNPKLETIKLSDSDIDSTPKKKRKIRKLKMPSSSSESDTFSNDEVKKVAPPLRRKRIQISSDDDQPIISRVESQKRTKRLDDTLAMKSAKRSKIDFSDEYDRPIRRSRKVVISSSSSDEEPKMVRHVEPKSVKKVKAPSLSDSDDEYKRRKHKEADNFSKRKRSIAKNPQLEDTPYPTMYQGGAIPFNEMFRRK